MEILGIIPARGGSKGIPNKNIVSLAGKPLLAYTAAAAQASRTLTRTMVSTDSSEIAAVAATLGLQVPWLRSAELSTDAALAIEVVRDVVQRYAAQQYHPEIVVLLQPTSPLRQAAHIDAAITQLIENPQANTVVSIQQVPHQFHPNSVLTQADGWVVPYTDQPSAVLRRQDKPVLWARNGPAVLAVRTDWILAGHGFYDGNTLGYIMDPLSSLDIDTPDDLKIAEALLKCGF